MGPRYSGSPRRAKCAWKYAARWSMAVTRRAKASGRASGSTSWVKVAVGSRFETTTGAVATSPSAEFDAAGRLRRRPRSRETFTWRRSSPPCRLEQRQQMVGDGAQPAAHLGHRRRPGRRQGKGEAQRAAGRVRTPEGGVDGEEAQHAAHRARASTCREGSDRRRPSRCRTWRSGSPPAPPRSPRRPTSRRATSAAGARRSGRSPGRAPRPRRPPPPCPAPPRCRACHRGARAGARGPSRGGWAAGRRRPMLADWTSGS